MSDEKGTTLQKDWASLNVGISKKVTDPNDPTGQSNIYEEIGKIIIPIPTLAAFGIEAAVKEVGEDGLPVYADEKLDWLFGAVIQSCKADARNKLVPQTADLKEGKKIASTFEELLAEGGDRGKYLEHMRELQKAFAGWFSTLGKSVQAQALALMLFKNREALSTQPQGMKDKMKAYLAQFAETLSPEDASRYGRFLLRVEEACAPVQVADF